MTSALIWIYRWHKIDSRYFVRWKRKYVETFFLRAKFEINSNLVNGKNLEFWHWFIFLLDFVCVCACGGIKVMTNHPKNQLWNSQINLQVRIFQQKMWKTIFFLFSIKFIHKAFELQSFCSYVLFLSAFTAAHLIVDDSFAANTRCIRVCYSYFLWFYFYFSSVVSFPKRCSISKIPNKPQKTVSVLEGSFNMKTKVHFHQNKQGKDREKNKIKIYKYK